MTDADQKPIGEAVNGFAMLKARQLTIHQWRVFSWRNETLTAHKVNLLNLSCGCGDQKWNQDDPGICDHLAVAGFAAEQTMDGLADSFPAGVLGEAVEAKVDKRFEWVLEDIATHTRDRMRDTIVEGLDEGTNPREVAKDLEDLFDGEFSNVRSTRIARTEMLSASNAGTHGAHVESDVVKMRSWLHTRDPGNPNHRPTHYAADQRTSKDPVGVNEPFTIDGIQVMYPGDFGDPSHDCNCRCSTVAEFPDRNYSEAEREKMWKQFVKRLDEQEKQTQTVARQAFSEQRDKVLRAFADAFDVDLEAVA